MPGKLIILQADGVDIHPGGDEGCRQSDAISEERVKSWYHLDRTEPDRGLILAFRRDGFLEIVQLLMSERA